MRLTDEEKRMLQGERGEIVRQAMAVLTRYGEALGAEKMVEVNTILGGPIGCGSTPLVMELLKKYGSFDALFGELGLCFDFQGKLPKMNYFTCTTTSSLDPSCWEAQEASREEYDFAVANEAFANRIGLHNCNTCAPYHSGVMPVFGEHCASMESSAVSFFNSVLGARTNTEGIESSMAAAFTGRVPYWGLHLSENRRGQYLVKAEIPVETMKDWGLLGYFFGEKTQEKIPVITGVKGRPTLEMLKHCGAAAASSGGVEMYHVVGITPEARDVADAFGGSPVKDTFIFDAAARKSCRAKLNTGVSEDVNHIILGCPHYSLRELFQLCRLLEGKKLSANTSMWVFAPFAVKELAKRQGYDRVLADAGATLICDACPALSGICPKHATSVATDSVKQAKYFHDITGIPTYFGSMEECVAAGLTGRWRGEA